MMNRGAVDFCPKQRFSNDEGARVWCVFSSNLANVRFNPSAMDIIGIGPEDRVCIMTLPDGSFYIAKSAGGRKLSLAGRSISATAKFPLFCKTEVATIKNGVAYFPAGTFTERAAS